MKGNFGTGFLLRAALITALFATSPAAFAPAAGIGEQAEGVGKAVGGYLDDSGITASVKAKLLAREGMEALTIHVTTVEGMVTLKGEVDTQAQYALAEEEAKSVKGVRGVTNNLTVKKALNSERADGMGKSVSGYLDDSGITAAVKTKLLTREGLETLGINVTTAAGVVRLEGTAEDPTQSVLIEEVAKSVKGVRGVENKLTLKNPTPAAGHVEDEALAMAVKKKIQEEQNIQSGREITFRVRSGVVVLSGEAANAGQAAAVEKDVRQIPGVKYVVNNVIIKE